MMGSTKPESDEFTSGRSVPPPVLDESAAETAPQRITAINIAITIISPCFLIFSPPLVFENIIYVHLLYHSGTSHDVRPNML